MKRGLDEWRARLENEGGVGGKWTTVQDTLFNAQSIQPLYLSLSVPPLSLFLIRMPVSREQVRGEKKRQKNANRSSERKKIEHPPLFCQSVSSVKHCSKCCWPPSVQGPFHLTCLCKRFSLRPKGGKCQGLDKVLGLPDGSWRVEREMERGWSGSQVSKESVL